MIMNCAQFMSAVASRLSAADEVETLAYMDRTQYEMIQVHQPPYYERNKTTRSWSLAIFLMKKLTNFSQFYGAFEAKTKQENWTIAQRHRVIAWYTLSRTFMSEVIMRWDNSWRSAIMTSRTLRFYLLQLLFANILILRFEVYCTISRVVPSDFFLHNCTAARSADALSYFGISILVIRHKVSWYGLFIACWSISKLLWSDPDRK